MRSGDSRCFAAGLILALSLGPALPRAHAQGPPGGGMMGGMGGPPLVMSEPVQDDLGLAEKQKAQLQKLEALMVQQTRATFEEARDNGLEPGEMMEAMGAIGREYNAAIAKVIDKNQKTRLAQLELQREGLLAVAKADVASKLKLAPAQSKKVKAIVYEMRQAQFAAMRPPPPAGDPGGAAPNPNPTPKSKGAASKGRRSAPAADAAQSVDGGGPPGFGPPGGGGFFGGMPDFNDEEFRARLAKMMESEKKLRDAATAKIGEVLTKEQTEAFDKMLGKPFDFSKLKFGPPGANPAPTGEATPKSDEGTPKKEAPAKSQPKSKTRKTGDQ